MTYYKRPDRRASWRKMHRFVALFWVMGIVHMIGAGSDAGQLWFLLIAGAVALPMTAVPATQIQLGHGREPR